MKTIIINVAFFLAFIVGAGVQAQVVRLSVINNIELKIAELQKQKNKIEKLEKDKLRQEVETINERLESNEITATAADQLKKKAAEKRARNIQSQLTIINENIALLERNTEQVESEDGEEKQEIDEYYSSLAFLRYDKKTDKFKDYDSIPSRTRKDIFVAFGLNHSLIDDVSLSDSPYELGGSRFFEIGYGWNTMLNKAGWLRINYALSLQMNGIKAKDNKYFVEDEDQTSLQEYPYQLDKAKLNFYNLVVPFHVEFGKATTAYGYDSAYYNLDHFKVGIGGYAGLNFGAKQKLKYEEDGKNKKEKIKEDYNVEKFVYGLSGYIGYGDWMLYAKYDLNTLFKDNPVVQHNVSLGLRLSL